MRQHRDCLAVVSGSVISFEDEIHARTRDEGRMRTAIHGKKFNLVAQVVEDGQASAAFAETGTLNFHGAVNRVVSHLVIRPGKKDNRTIAAATAA